MELLQLRYFCVVARQQSVTKAAAELLVSQPSLSKTIRALERELGCELFERGGRVFRLSRSGEQFYQQVTQSLRLLDDATRQLRDRSGDPEGEVRLLVLAASAFMMELYDRFHRLYPGVRLIVSNYVQPDRLLVQECDLCISGEKGLPSGAERVTLLSEPLALAVPRGHPLERGGGVELAEAAPYPFVDTNLHRDLRELCLQAGFLPDVVMQVDNIHTLVYMLRAGVGIAMVPRLTLGAMLPDNIMCVPFRAPEARRSIVLSWDRGRFISRAADAFRGFCIQYFRELGQV